MKAYEIGDSFEMLNIFAFFSVTYKWWWRWG